MKRSILATLLLPLLIGCSFEERQSGGIEDTAVTPEMGPRKEIIQPEGVARLPVFSSAVRSGDLIFLLGQLGARPG